MSFGHQELTIEHNFLIAPMGKTGWARMKSFMSVIGMKLDHGLGLLKIGQRAKCLAQTMT